LAPRSATRAASCHVSMPIITLTFSLVINSSAENQ
jgi:hypothetical protein